MLQKKQSEKEEILTQFKGKYTVIEEIGKGAFSKVIKCQDKKGDYVAIKIINLQNLGQIEKEYMMNEVNLTSQNKENQNVIRLLDSVSTQSKIYLVIDYCVIDAEYMRTNIFDEKIPEDLVMILFKQLINGFKFLHQNNIMHRDIKLENIGVYMGNVDRKNIKEEDLWKATFKLIDFGLSKKFSNQEFTTTVIGTPINMAPEVLEEEPYTLNADVYSLGCCLYKAVVGKYPYFEKQKEMLLQKIRADNVDMSSIQNQELKNLIQQMLKYDSEERIKWVEIYQQIQQDQLDFDQINAPDQNQAKEQYLIFLDEDIFSKSFGSHTTFQELFMNTTKDKEVELLINMFENLDFDSPNDDEKNQLLKWQYDLNLSQLLIHTSRLINDWLAVIQKYLKEISYNSLQTQFEQYVNFLVNLAAQCTDDVRESMNRMEDKFINFSKFHTIRKQINPQLSEIPKIVEETQSNHKILSSISFFANTIISKKSEIKVIRLPFSYSLKCFSKNEVSDDQAIVIENNKIIFLMTKRIIEDSFYQYKQTWDEKKKVRLNQVQGKLYKTLIYLVLIKGLQESIIPLEYNLEQEYQQIKIVEEMNEYDIPNNMAELVSKIQDRFSIKYE